MKRKRDKIRENIIYENFIFSLRYLKNIEKHFWFALVLLFGVALFGFVFPVFFEEQIIKLIEELIKMTEGLNAVELMQFIIFNNMKSAFFGMIFGVFFGLVPIGVVIVNGYVLGFVLNKSVLAEGPVVLWRLFPHGIFEIPAVLISVGLGLRLGTFLFVYKGKNKWREFWRWIKDSLRVFVFIIIPLLVIAGIIEGGLIALVG